MKIRYITPFVNEDFFCTVKKGMRDAGELFQAEVSFVGPEDADCGVISRLIGEAVQEGCDGLAISVADAEKLNPAIQAARDAGVPSVAFNIGGGKDTPVLSNICQDYYAAGVKVGRRAAAKIEKGATVLLTLHDDVEVLRERERGIKDGLAAKDVKTVTIVSGNEPELAAASIRRALEQIPAVQAVIGTGQSDTHGAGLVAKETGMYTAGFDVCGEILEMVKAGIIDFTIDQQPYIQGFYPVLQLCQYIRYGLVPSDIDAGNGMIGPENVDKVIAISKEGYR